MILYTSRYRSFTVCALAIMVTVFVAAGTARAAGDKLVAKGAQWSFLDDGTDPGSTWVFPGFNDAQWASGFAPLGYGDGDEATVVDFGPDAANKYITTYFRHSFNIVSAATIEGLSLRLLRDDGAVVYLNGAEVVRSNMPAGVVTNATPAASAIGGAAEDDVHESCIDPALLLDGVNVLAVEVHQHDGSSSDISLELELLASEITRGPYLQMGTANSVTLNWRTCGASDSRVRYGLDTVSLNSVADDLALVTEHSITLNGLSPDTPYFYSVGTTAKSIEGGGAGYGFVTSPVLGTAKPTRIWVIGDSGTADANAAAVRNGYSAYTGNTLTDLWLMLGDNAYPVGTDEQYQNAVFDMYPKMLRTSVLWPTLGNHDAEPLGVSASSELGPYFDMFSLPSSGQAGGLASGTESYYSFDYGNIHFVNLNSTGSDRSVGGAMLTWLDNDLAATSQDWIIAYWHHPPYTRGSHSSDNPFDSSGRMFDMRENALPILESYGVDLVLTGHSHSYERSYLIDGHYDVSSTLTPAMIVDGGDGRPFSSGMYVKPTLGPGANEGAIYSVVGNSGKVSGGALDHPAMAVSLSVLGSLVLDVDGNELEGNFIDNTGNVLDNFKLIKGPRNPAITDIQANGSDGPVVLTQGDDLTVTLQLDAGEYEGDPAEWWIFILYYNATSATWETLSNIHLPDLPVFNLSPLELINSNSFPATFYLFFYGVDTKPNGQFDGDSSFLDSLLVEIQ